MFPSPLLLLLLPSVLAVVLPSHDIHDPPPDHVVAPNTWYHPPHHPSYRLFKRDPPADGGQYPQVGSPSWSAQYPASTPDSSRLPQAWVNALNAAVAAGSVPNIPPTTVSGGQNPRYPDGYDPAGPLVCSGTSKCRNPSDFWDAPPGYFGTGFDDGPTDGSPMLYQFLQAHNLTATHFMIGIQILALPQVFQFAFDTLQGDIAVHTWTHPHMTTLSNLDVLAQLGWSMQLIHDSTGGRLPRFWRPPYGDSDNRVRAIAQQVFGLQTIFWNQDTADWSLTTPGRATPQAINNSFTQWLTGPKTPGLIVLEHELFIQSAQAFIDAYPVIVANGWKMQSVTQLIGNGTVYQNSANASSPVTSVSVLSSNIASSTSTVSPTTATASSSPAASTTAKSNRGLASSSIDIPWTIIALIITVLFF